MVSTTSASAPTRNDVAAVHSSLPGCGLAAYMTLLLIVMAFGGTMALMSGLTIVASSQSARPTRLMYGGDVEPYLLNGLRSVNLLAPGEIPDAFHAEDWSGMAVCAVTHTHLLRLGAEGALRVPFTGISTVEEVQGGVRIHGAWQVSPNTVVQAPAGPVSEVLCAFEPEDGGDRFASLLRASSASR